MPIAQSLNLNAPGSQNPYNKSEEEDLSVTRPTESSSEPPPPMGSLAAPVEEPPAVAPPIASNLPSLAAVSESRENVLSPVKVDGEAVGPAVTLPEAIEPPARLYPEVPVPVVSAVNESVHYGALKVEDEPAPLFPDKDEKMGIDTTPVPVVKEDIANRDEDVKMNDINQPSAVPLQVKDVPPAGLESVAPASSQSEEPPAKRQRKSESVGSGAGEGKITLAGPEATKMTQAQIKFSQNAIKALKGRPEAGPFLNPVDPIALNIPHYPDRIKEPRDLGTIDIRLALTAAAAKGGSKPTEKTKLAPKWNLDPVKDVYADVEEFERDVRLVFNNCITFNGPDHILSQHAKNLEGLFDKQLKTLPSAAPVTPAVTSDTAIGMFESPNNSVSNGISARRDSDVGSRPKRDIHPPAPKDLPWTDRPQAAPGTGKRKKTKRPLTAREEAYYEKITKEQLKQVSKFVDDLHKQPMSNFAWVFFTKPTMDLDFAPSYYAIIKKPVSLKEIKERLLRNEYEDIVSAKEDIDLMLNNCFSFNETGSDVWSMGMEVKKAWDAKLARLPQPAPLENEYEEDEDEEDAETAAQIQSIRDQIATLQAQLDGLLQGNGKAKSVGAAGKAGLAAASAKKSAKKRHPSESGGSIKKQASNKKPKVATAGPSNNAGVGVPEAKKAKAKKQKEGKKRDEDVRDVTYEQKEELAAKITQLPDDRLEGALKIIAEDKPQNANDDEEIELDIDDLSPQTLYKLYRYVVRPKGKKMPSKVSSSDGRKRGTGGVKRKNLDEGQEAARIARLQEQLQQFDNPEGSSSSIMQGSGPSGAHDDLVASESSSGEEESESESDFD